MTTPRRIRHRSLNAADDTDLRVALATADSLQSTIRAADAKIASLATVASGAVVLIGDRIAPGPAVPVAYACLVATAIGSAVVVAWCLILAIRPRTPRPVGTNRFALASIVAAGDRPAPGGARRVRAEAEQHVSILAGIAMRKHELIRRSLPWVAAELAATAALLVLTALVS
ncbi:hypothetical protein [Actinoplanes sp. NPDC051494]|uniref:hypothetical protein n=1 Tax=Actinoplanes sp. NPDC051494 TaxID=3363907 RepID=UPI00378FA6E9